MFDELSKDLVAAAMLEASYGGQEAYWNYLMVLHPHFNLCERKFMGRNKVIRVLECVAACSDKFAVDLRYWPYELTETKHNFMRA